MIDQFRAHDVIRKLGVGLRQKTSGEGSGCVAETVEILSTEGDGPEIVMERYSIFPLRFGMNIHSAPAPAVQLGRVCNEFKMQIPDPRGKQGQDYRIWSILGSVVVSKR